MITYQLLPHRIAEPRRLISAVAVHFDLPTERVHRAVKRLRKDGVDWEGEAAYLRKAFRVAFRNRHKKGK
jgi:hypothetical protein